jgi:hypothetical protein
MVYAIDPDRIQQDAADLAAAQKRDRGVFDEALKNR